MTKYFFYCFLYSCFSITCCAQNNDIQGDWRCIEVERKVMSEYLPPEQHLQHLRIKHDSIQYLEYPCQLYAKTLIPTDFRLQKDTLRLDIGEYTCYYVRDTFDEQIMAVLQTEGIYASSILAHHWELVVKYDFDGDDEPIQKIKYPVKLPLHINSQQYSLNAKGFIAKIGNPKRAFQIKKISLYNRELWLRPLWYKGAEEVRVWYRLSIKKQ